MIEVPIYLFTGFLDSGKTTVIKDTLEDPTFNSDNPTTLIICLEQGEEEYDEDYLKANNADIEYLDSSVYLTDANTASNDLVSTVVILGNLGIATKEETEKIKDLAMDMATIKTNIMMKVTLKTPEANQKIILIYL